MAGSCGLSRADDVAEHQEKLNGGYYLLHQLCSDEASLPLLLDLKHASPEIKQLAVKISQTAKESNASLEQMQDGDPALKFDRNPLPSIEREVRDSITAEKEHQLLFGTSNDDFARALLVSQIEASSYAHNLAKVLSGEETDDARQRVLRRMSARWQSLHQEEFRLLAEF